MLIHVISSTFLLLCSCVCVCVCFHPHESIIETIHDATTTTTSSSFFSNFICSCKMLVSHEHFVSFKYGNFRAILPFIIECYTFLVNFSLSQYFPPSLFMLNNDVESECTKKKRKRRRITKNTGAKYFKLLKFADSSGSNEIGRSHRK